MISFIILQMTLTANRVVRVINDFIYQILVAKSIQSVPFGVTCLLLYNVFVFILKYLIL